MVEPRGRSETHVLLVVSGRMFGGGQRLVMDIHELLRKGGVSTKIVLLGKTIEVLDRLSPIVIAYDGRYNNLVTLMRTAVALRKIVSHVNPAFIHTHGWDADMIGGLARVGKRTNHVVHLHVTPQWLSSKKARHIVRRWITRRLMSIDTSKTVAVSEAVRSWWIKGLNLDPGAICVVHNAVELTRFNAGRRANRTSDVPIVGVVARLAPMKGLNVLVDALGVLNREGICFEVRIAGSGELRSSLEKQVTQMGLANITRFLGHIEDIDLFYRDIDIFVLPSVSTEGMPLTVLEAMAARLPVVATDIGGTAEALRQDTDGFLVPPRDSESLAEKLKMLLIDDKLRKSMGDNGRRRVEERFAMNSFASNILALYE